MLKFKEFSNWLHVINEKTNKEVTLTLVSKYPDKIGIHSNTDRVKNLANISINDFADMIRSTFNVEPIVNKPGRSGSSKFSSVQFDIDGNSKNIILAGGAVASRGHGFEDNFLADMQTFQANRDLESENYNYPNIVKAIAKQFNITEKTSFIVPDTKAGSANNKREVSQTKDGIVIGNGNLDIGSTVTDITLDIDGKPYYISLKLGNTVQFSNTGLVDIFKKEDIIKGNISTDIGRNLLNMLGIDMDTFCDVFNSYGKKKFKEKHELEKSFDPKALESFVQSAMGYGYYMLHISDNEKTFEFYEVNEAEMKASTKIVSKMDILYGGVSGGAKNVNVTFKTKSFLFDIDFRNRSGGIEPTVMGTKYKYNIWKGTPVK